MHCPSCGKEVPDQAKFCRGCGTPLPQAAPPAYQPPAPPPPPPPAPAYEPPPAYAQPQYPPQASYPATPPPSASYPPPPPPNYGAPYGAAPQPAYAPAPSMGPMPPSMHWALALVLVMITGGIFGLILIFMQTSFVKKIDPSSKATMQFVMSMVCIFVVMIVIIGGSVLSMGLVAGMSAGVASGDVPAAVPAAMPVMMIAVFGVAFLLELIAAVLSLVAIFGMRRSIVNYYNTTEPINLRLSGVMTFFFNVYYFQYHFARIAQWKSTGVFPQ